MQRKILITRPLQPRDGPGESPLHRDFAMRFKVVHTGRPRSPCSIIMSDAHLRLWIMCMCVYAKGEAKGSEEVQAIIERHGRLVGFAHASVVLGHSVFFMCDNQANYSTASQQRRDQQISLMLSPSEETCSSDFHLIFADLGVSCLSLCTSTVNKHVWQMPEMFRRDNLPMISALTVHKVLVWSTAPYGGQECSVATKKIIIMMSIFARNKLNWLRWMGKFSTQFNHIQKCPLSWSLEIGKYVRKALSANE